MAFWCSRLTQSKLRQLAHHSKTIPYASSLLNPTASKPCVSDNPLISHPDFIFASKVRFFAAPVQANANAKKTEQGTSGPRLNEHIRANVVRLVMGEEHFVISKSEALERARNLELDLVEVQGTANPPVCKIMDYHKEKYKKETREKEQIKIKSKEVKTLRADTKEVKFSPKTEAKDLKMKADMVKRFMDKGYRVKCTASDSEGRDLGAVFSRLIALIEDTAYIECEPTVGRGKESFIMVRHVKFGPPKSGGKKTKAENKKSPEKGSGDGIGVTTRADTVPLPPQESSGVAENRYRNTEVSPTREMDSKRETPNNREIPISHFSPSMREQHIPYQRREAPTNVHFSSPTRETNRAAPSAFRNSAQLPNSIPKQEPSNPNPNPPRSAGFKQEPSSPNPPRSRPPGLGYGIFSTPTGNGSAKQGVSERFPANPNSPSSRPYSSQRPGTDIGEDGRGMGNLW
ncbi:translation initiation factor IF3-1, mitochondrial [Rosa rugosa]|uniref:translation initiation factor IF3-1, mitochondrial n=1 Tax=Rosa rugosa TaxID=74645 RepID=UPI002B40C835|nr:translation initiation factor IF3-1, mitochondrial [Rosa rugosa]